MKRLTRKVNELLKQKGHDIYSVQPTDTVRQAVKVMKEHNIGSVLVLDGEDDVAGILSERDCARKMLIDHKNPDKVPVQELMETDVVSVDTDMSVKECMAIMTKGRLRHLPVYEDGALVGIISVGDIVKSVIDKQKRTIEHLENYIRSDHR